MTYKFKAVLFDFDGVIVDTEGQYSKFWKKIGQKFYPTIKNFENQVKGETLCELLDKYFPKQSDRVEVVDGLRKAQEKMVYKDIPDSSRFVEELRVLGIKTAVVTSSDRNKMDLVYAQRPDIPALFDRILTSEDYDESKPLPDCYVKAANLLGFEPEQCVVAEDSINGLKSAKASGAFVLGLSTTNPIEVIKPYADLIIPDFVDFTPELLEEAYDCNILA